MDPWNGAGGQNRAAGSLRRKAASMFGSLTAIVGIMAASALPAAADGAVRKQADFNGDGYADLAVGAPGEDYRVFTGTGYYYDLADAGVVHITYGWSGGLAYGRNQLLSRATEPLGIPNMPAAGQKFGAALTWGDFNNDGFDDLAVGVPYASPVGAVDIYFGSSNGLSDRANQIMRHDQMQYPKIAHSFFTQFGYALAAGDANADGFDDLAISQEYGNQGGAVYLAPGSAVGLRPAAAQTLSHFSIYGPRSMAFGDFNGDGRSDLAMGLPYDRPSGISGAGAVHVVFGTIYGLSFVPQIWTQNSPNIPGICETNDSFGYAVTAADFNADGKWDLAVGAPGENVNSGVAHVLFGWIGGLSASGTQIWSQDNPGVPEVADAGDRFGESLATALLNQDGFPELIVGVPGEDEGRGGVHEITVITSQAWWANQYWNQDSYQVHGIQESEDRFGSSLSVGDFNKDGRHDLAIGVPGENTRTGCVNVLFGSFGAGLTWVNNQILMQGIYGVLETQENGDNFGVL